MGARYGRFGACALLLAAAVGCAGPDRSIDSQVPGAIAVLGEASFVRPVAGISAEAAAAYHRGRTLFDKPFTPDEGLGPLYNNISCKACHGFPNSGGASAEALTVIAGEYNGAPVTLKEDGGPVISDRAVQGVPIEALPLQTVAISKRISPPTYGEGLIEAIPAKAILAALLPSEARTALGIRGRANWDFNQIGRFGWKAQTGDMVSFTVTAANFEMGLSSPQRPYEFFPNMAPQAHASPAAYAKSPVVKAFFDARGPAARKPDLSAQEVDDLTAFQRYQAPPPPLALTAQARDGGALFNRVGCVECHTPAFQTGPNKIGIPEGLDVALYSDLLLHDMGAELADGIRWQGRAGSQDWRTPTLWGLRFRQRFMHDGRASSLEDAIQWHGGEGQAVTDAYNRLAAGEKDSLRAFLMSI